MEEQTIFGVRNIFNILGMEILHPLSAINRT